MASRAFCAAGNPPMPDDDDAIIVPLDPPDHDRMYRNYLETWRSGVTSVLRNRALDLIAGWAEIIAASRAPPLH